MYGFFLDIIKSEFLWGTILGLVLTYIGGYLTLRSQRKSQEKLVKDFCEDTITNIQEYINLLDQFRDRSRKIYDDFLSLIEVEIQTYGKNREYLVSIKDRKLRKKAREFFTDIAVQLMNTKRHLEGFENLYRAYQNETDNDKKMQLELASDNALKEAHKSCDRLVSIANRAEDLKIALTN